MNIQITRVDGAICVNPAPAYITNYLQYSHRSFGLKGWKRVNVFTKKELYSTAPEGGVITFTGFFSKLYELITKEGDTLVVSDMRTPIKEPDLEAIKNINWEGIGSTGLRDYQVEPIVEFLFKAKDENGICCATGAYGKTILMACTYAAFHHIGPTIVATPLQQVFNQTYDKFVKLFPDRHIGRVGNGYCDISTDVTVATYKSLPRCPLEKCKLLLMDEIQCTTGNSIVETLSSVTPVRMFGYTATDKDLFNGADKLIKGLFGERLIYVPYQDAQDVGAVVPCKVYMIKVPEQAAFSANSIEGKLLRGIKRNEVRNRLVGEACRLVPEDWQTLVFIDNIEDHLIPLYNFMPEGTRYIHRGQGKQFGAFSLSAKKQEKTIEQFANGEFKYLLATDCLRAGADIPQIKVVVQASGGTSSTELLQEAYRGARTAPGKTHMILLDFEDNHDPTLENMAIKRVGIYEKQGWQVIHVDDPKDIDWSYVDKVTGKRL